MISWALKKVIGVLVALLVLLAASLVVAKLLGGGAYTVLSGSMEPAYHVGSLVYVRPVDPAKLEEGDVITFAIAEDMTATHRIVGISKADPGNADGTDEGLQFTTKGDANDSEDAAPVEEKNVIGTPLFSIPYVGYVVTYIRKPLQWFVDLL